MQRTPIIRKGSALEILSAPTFDLPNTHFYDKLGEGAFGKVRLAIVESEPPTAVSTPEGRKNANGKAEKKGLEDKLVAVKILSKQALIDAKQVDHVYNEMNLTSKLVHPFIVSSHPARLE
mmetsp:Transcript_40453/g.38940  ORF Transcript_40453/g.38940 Transcript_40453/m.38940 type:complete len:120 (+) Transcript_40453:36-395(+)